MVAITAMVTETVTIDRVVTEAMMTETMAIDMVDADLRRDRSWPPGAYLR